MEWTVQMMARALNAMAPLSIGLCDNGTWVVRQPGLRLVEGRSASTPEGSGPSADAAIAARFKALTQLKPGVRVSYFDKLYRWDDFMWREIQPAQQFRPPNEGVSP